MKMTLLPQVLKLKHPFKIAYGEGKITQETLIVELEHEGCRGYGEATTNHYYGETIQVMVERLEEQRARIEAADPREPEALWDSLDGIFANGPFALCALDEAAHDLNGKLRGKPLHALWGLDSSAIPQTDYTIGIASIPEMVAKMRELPWPIYKIKLGTDEDIEIVRALREHTDAIIRVDANCAWTARQTIDNSRELKKLGVEFIEQPLPAEQHEDMREVYAESALPVIADESCRRIGDVERCHEYFHGVNIKLTKAGGITPARRMIQTARDLGMQVMIGCMTESSVGMSAIGQLLPLLDYVDMDGPLLIAEDPAEGVRLTPERIILPDGPGTGAVLKGR